VKTLGVACYSAMRFGVGFFLWGGGGGGVKWVVFLGGKRGLF